MTDSMYTDEFVQRVIVSIPARRFTIFSNKESSQTIICETPEQFQDVLSLCRKDDDLFNSEYEY